MTAAIMAPFADLVVPLGQLQIHAAWAAAWHQHGIARCEGQLWSRLAEATK
jgi:hypothetical protein